MPVANICLLGGTGFVGRRICAQLAKRPAKLRVLTRNAALNRDLLVIPNLELIETNVFDPKLLRAQLSGIDTVINLVGILNEKRRGDFERVHVELPRMLLAASREAGVRRLLHMCALGAAPDAPSRYQRTKAAGEQLVLAANGPDLAVTSFRPSVIFGPGDSLFNRFARLLALSPLFFPLPTPNTRFRPVFVDDVARAFVVSLDNPRTFGRSYELCGPRTFTLRELVAYTAELTHRTRTIVGLPDWASRLQARLLGLLPGRPYTMDNYLSATVDNVCAQDGLAELGIEQKIDINAVVPHYLASFTWRARYNVYRQWARRQ